MLGIWVALVQFLDKANFRRLQLCSPLVYITLQYLFRKSWTVSIQNSFKIGKSRFSGAPDEFKQGVFWLDGSNQPQYDVTPNFFSDSKSPFKGFQMIDHFFQNSFGEMIKNVKTSEREFVWTVWFAPYCNSMWNNDP